MASILINDLTLRYEGAPKPAIEQVTLDINDGEFLVVLGESGSGKSTLLRAVAGLLESPAGRLCIERGSLGFGGEIATHRPTRERNLALMFQHPNPLPRRPLWQTVASPLIYRGVPVATARTRAFKLAATLRLDAQILEKRPHQVSGGQLQRVLIARAIIRPDLNALLLDEPFSQVDAQMRIDLRRLVRQLHHERGTTTIYVTHDQEEALALADRLAILRRGRLLQVGPAREVYDRPADITVARFLGNPPMNLLRARVSEAGVLDAAGSRIKLGWKIPDGVSDVFFGMRAEYMTLTDKPGADTVGPLRVARTEFGGRRELVRLLGPNADVTVEKNGGSPWIEGQEIWVTMDPKHSIMFNARTGERIATEEG